MKVRALASVSLLASVGCAGCDGGSKQDAPVIDIDNGTCGAELRFTGELVNWDSNDTTFCGVFDATFQIQPTGASDQTAPNGRFDMCVPKANATTTILVTTAADSSPCAGSMYGTPALVVANREVIQAGGDFSGRLFTDERKLTLYQTVGVAFDATKAAVLVHTFNTPRAVSLDAAHDQSLAWTRDTHTWAAGDTGFYVYFPNVDVGAGTAKVAVTGGAFGTGDIPLQAGKVTELTVMTK